MENNNVINKQYLKEALKYHVLLAQKLDHKTEYRNQLGEAYLDLVEIDKNAAREIAHKRWQVSMEIMNVLGAINAEWGRAGNTSIFTEFIPFRKMDEMDDGRRRDTLKKISWACNIADEAVRELYGDYLLAKYNDSYLRAAA